MTHHERFMRRALTLARRGRGRVSPNPMVGAVVARDGTIVGEGSHVFEQKDHAEVIALRNAGDLARGADLYVTLEPCDHQGRTAPCSRLIAAAGIGRLFYGSPDPSAAGGGARRLRRQGVEVVGGILEEACRALNEVFFHCQAHRRPFVLLKLGLSLDGRIAGPRRDSRWITGEAARKWVHRLRFEYDAILVGIETVLADNPSLDVRTARPNSIHKVVLDSGLRTPPPARLFESGDPVTIFHSRSNAQARHLSAAATTMKVSRDDYGLSWGPILGHLYERGVCSLLVEGGGRIAAGAVRAGIVDKLALFYGPRLIGSGGVAGVADLSIDRLSEAPQWGKLRCRRLGTDLLVEAYPATEPG